MKQITPPEDDRLARDFIAALRENDSTRLLKELGQNIQGVPAFRDSLRAAGTELPKGQVDTLRQVGANISRNQTGDISALTYELHTATGWGLANVVIMGPSDGRAVTGFRVVAIAASLEELNSFRRGAKHPGRWIVLLLAVCVAAFSIWMAVVAARTRMKRRWWWALFALIGVAPFILNWTTGEVAFQLLQIVFLSAAFVGTPPFGPWMVTVAFPIGAIATLYHVRQQRAAAAAPPIEPIETIDSTVSGA